MWSDFSQIPTRPTGAAVTRNRNEGTQDDEVRCLTLLCGFNNVKASRPSFFISLKFSETFSMQHHHRRADVTPPAPPQCHQSDLDHNFRGLRDSLASERVEDLVITLSGTSAYTTTVVFYVQVIT
jgi:hypothetical protein